MATIFPTSVPTKRLSESITGSSSSFKVNNILGWDAAALTSADFGTKAYGVFRNSANTLMELFEYDPSTIASTSITILLRGLKFTGDLTTEVSGNKLTWVKGDTVVELGAHVPQLLKQMVTAIGDQTIADKKTFSTIPASTGTPVASTDLTTKTYVDALAMGGTTTVDRVVIAGTAGETVAAGNSIYFKASDGRWWKTDADDSATVNDVILAIAQGAGTAGNAITGGVLLHGLDSNQSGLTGGATQYVSNTAGGISATAGTNTRIIGQARTTTTLYFDPFYRNNITLAANVQNGSYIYAADSVGTDAYAVTLSPVPGAYTTGMLIHFKAGTLNTAAATLNVNALGAKTIKKNVTDDLNTGDIAANQICTVIYDGTNFQLLSKTPTLAPTTQVFTASGTWTKPAGLKYVVVEGVGGGGGGGGTNTDGTGSAGGGGGGYSRKTVAAASLGATETVTIGAAGTAGAGTGTAGGAGGTTSFGAHISMTGGGGGGGQGGTGGAAGIGSSGDINLGGGGGGHGGVGGTAADFGGGIGGSSRLGGGGKSSEQGQPGTAGQVYGGGGSGGASNGPNAAGGAGAAGVVIVTEFYA